MIYKAFTIDSGCIMVIRMEERQGGQERPNHFSNQNSTRQKEQSGAHTESSANIPLFRLSKRPHEELVKAFQNHVQEMEQGSRGDFVPAEFIKAMIVSQGDLRNREEDFYMQLSSAWDVVAYDFYEPGSFFEHHAGKTLSDYYKYSNVEAIKLSDPQVRILDALTEAVGIPHEQGQPEIEIPEKLRNYHKWVRSKEYKERIDKAIAEREIRKTKLIFGRIEPKTNK
jgi:hypothetical protein